MKICGLDEVGRGSLAGPLVAAGVILKKPVSGLNDSKKLSRNKREKIYEQLKNSGAVIKIEIISARTINTRGITYANKEIFKRLIKATEADKYIVDGKTHPGKVRGKTDKIKPIIGADRTRKSVMAASIAAKVTRDKIMEDLHIQYPQYGWDKNSGYGTRQHIAAIIEFGTVKCHRDIWVTTALTQKVS
jgi:ribonuclease HII